MSPLAKAEAHWDWSEKGPVVTSPTGFLNHLRFLALACRAKARTDLFEACMLLASDPSQSTRAHAEALVGSLPEALGRQPRFFRPGTDEVSFDEAWLRRLAISLRQEDEPSVNFLLFSRVPPMYHRELRFLIARITAPFSLA